MRAQIAKWDSARDAWTDESRIDLFSELSDAYLGTFPTSGMTRSGAAYALPTWEPATHGSGFSSSPADALLPTVTVQDGANTGGPSQFDRNTPPLNTRVLMLPTPVAQPSGNTPEDHLRKKPGRTQVTDLAIITENGLLPSGGKLLPTPTTSETTGPGLHGTGGPNLRTVVSLMPTPKASDGEKGGPNQRGSSGDLTMPSVAVRIGKLLPTTTAMDANGSRNATANREPGAKFKTGTTLTDALVPTEGKLLPTPAAMDGSGGRITKEKGGFRESGAKRSITLGTAVHHDLKTLQSGTNQPQNHQQDAMTEASQIGASTSQLSGAGSKSSAAQLPGQLSLLDVMEGND